MPPPLDASQTFSFQSPTMPLQAVTGLVQKAGDRQPSLGPAIRQHRSRRHEPQPADIIIHTLRMRPIVAVIARHPGEQILVALTRHQIAVIQGRPPEIRQQRVARAVHANLVTALHLNGIKHMRSLLHRDSDDQHPAHPAGAGRATYCVRSANTIHHLWCGRHNPESTAAARRHPTIITPAADGPRRAPPRTGPAHPAPRRPAKGSTCINTSPAMLLRRVEPVVAIRQPGPGQATGTASGRPGLRVDQEAIAPFS